MRLTMVALPPCAGRLRGVARWQSPAPPRLSGLDFSTLELIMHHYIRDRYQRAREKSVS